MSEYCYNPTTDELYSEYKMLISGLDSASRELPIVDPEATDRIQEVDNISNQADMELEARQAVIDSVVRMKNSQMQLRLDIQAINKVLALQAVQSHIIIARHVYAAKKINGTKRH